MEADETLRRIIADNRQSRQVTQQRLARLSDVLQYGTVEEYRDAVQEIFNDDDTGAQSQDSPGQN
jgi:hypothetical protein